MWVCYHGSTRRLNREVGFCGFVITGAPITGAPEGSTGRLVFVGLLSREHPKAQPGSWFLSHLLIAGCDIGVQISVRPYVRSFVRSSVRSSVNIYVEV